MKPSMIISLVLGALMALSAGASKLVTPTNFTADKLPFLDLDAIIPVQIGDWVEQKNLVSAVINPQSQELINKIYTRSLSRTYVNGQGEKIMLSVNYGADQRDGTQAHQPESCYPAQGFQVQSLIHDALITPLGEIPVKRLETNMANQRYEPVTYWLTIGNRVILDGTQKKIIEMSYGLKGEIPDGLLFRVSSIDRDTKHAFTTQDSFVNSLVSILPVKDRTRLTGLH